MPRGGWGPPCNTWYLGPTRVINPNGISIGSAVYVCVPNAMLYNALLTGKKTPQNAPSPWDFGTPPEEDPATAISNMHKKFIKIVCVVREICSQTDRHTQTDVLISH